MDPREAIVRDRLSSVRRVIAFASSKGGVGKTCVACASALALRELGYRVGLLDLDITNPTAHIVLGVDPRGAQIEEEKGVKPVKARGIEFMSPALFTRGEPSPLRGSEIHDAILEILAVTRWGELDFLLIDAPPGMADEILDALKYVPRIEFVIVATPSPLSIDSVKRFTKFLVDEGARVLGLVENMGSGELEPLSRALGVKYLGYVPYDPELDRAIAEGRIDQTRFYAKIRDICRSAFHSL